MFDETISAEFEQYVTFGTITAVFTVTRTVLAVLDI